MEASVHLPNLGEFGYLFGVTEVVRLQSLNAADRSALASRAALLIERGALVLLPTETVYGLAASAAVANALGSLAALTPAVRRTVTSRAVGTNGFTWHAPDPASVARALKITAPVHARIFEKLTPGPVRLMIESDIDKPIAGEITGAFRSGDVISVRIPDHGFSREVLARVKSPVAMDRVPSAISSAGARLDGADLEAALAAADVALCIDDGATKYGKVSSALRLTSAGGYKVEAESAVSAREIDEAIATRVLFVCSGNTCRSPMAERIARDLVERAPSVPVIVESAGTSAVEGEPSSEEGDQALTRMGIPEPKSRHRSHAVTKDMIRRSDFVFAMTRAHRDALLSIAPDAGDKVMLLDSAGDIPDPIGAGLEAYRKTAERIRLGILQRFAEKRLSGETSKPHKPRARTAGEKS